METFAIVYCVSQCGTRLSGRKIKATADNPVDYFTSPSVIGVRFANILPGNKYLSFGELYIKKNSAVQYGHQSFISCRGQLIPLPDKTFVLI